TFPVTWHGAVLSLGWPFADGDSIDDLSQSALGVGAFGLTHLPRRPQMCHQLFLQHAAGLNKKTSIDRLRRPVEPSVKSGHCAGSGRCRVYPQKRISRSAVGGHSWPPLNLSFQCLLLL